MISRYEIGHLRRKLPAKDFSEDAIWRVSLCKSKGFVEVRVLKVKALKREAKARQGSHNRQSRGTEAPSDFPSAFKGGKKLELSSNSASELISKKNRQTEKVEIS